MKSKTRHKTQFEGKNWRKNHKHNCKVAHEELQLPNFLLNLQFKKSIMPNIGLHLRSAGSSSLTSA